RTAAPSDDAAARNLAAVPEVLRPRLVFPFFSHREILPLSFQFPDGKTPAAGAGAKHSLKRDKRSRRARRRCAPAMRPASRVAVKLDCTPACGTKRHVRALPSRLLSDTFEA